MKNEHNYFNSSFQKGIINRHVQSLEKTRKDTDQKMNSEFYLGVVRCQAKLFSSLYSLLFMVRKLLLYVILIKVIPSYLKLLLLLERYIFLYFFSLFLLLQKMPLVFVY